jgi:hypothetical protein
MLEFWSAIFLVFFGSFVGGICGSYIFSWDTRRLLASLQYSVEDLEGRVVREVKIRAGTKARQAEKEDENLAMWAADELRREGPKESATVPPLSEWYKKKMAKQG